MIAEILNPDGTVANTIVAEADFLEEVHPGAWREVVPTSVLQDLKVATQATIDRRRDDLLAVGASASGGLHVAVDDKSRADLGGMATTAALVLSGAVEWPEEYARGWIPIENAPRIPLPNPGDGVALALMAARYYAGVVQHARDLKDEVLAAVDEAAVAAIDITAGWPA